jgi:hypothetical protein
VSYSPQDLEAIAKKVRYDLTAAQGKLTDLLNGISELAEKLPDDGHAFVCPQDHCGLKFPTAQRLVEHRENVHGVRV